MQHSFASRARRSLTDRKGGMAPQTLPDLGAPSVTTTALPAPPHSKFAERYSWRLVVIEQDRKRLDFSHGVLFNPQCMEALGIEAYISMYKRVKMLEDKKKGQGLVVFEEEKKSKKVEMTPKLIEDLEEIKRMGRESRKARRDSGVGEGQ